MSGEATACIYSTEFQDIFPPVQLQKNASEANHFVSTLLYWSNQVMLVIILSFLMTKLLINLKSWFDESYDYDIYMFGFAFFAKYYKIVNTIGP